MLDGFYNKSENNVFIEKFYRNLRINRKIKCDRNIRININIRCYKNKWKIEV